MTDDLAQAVVEGRQKDGVPYAEWMRAWRSRNPNATLDQVFEASKIAFDQLSDEQKTEMERQQRESWVRGEMAMGSDRDEAEYRARMK